MYIITDSGDRITVDSSVNNNGYRPCYQIAAVINDDSLHLEDAWIIELQQTTKHHARSIGFELDFVGEFYYDHEPSQDEIMAAIVKSGGSPFDTFAFVRHGYVMNYGEDE